MEYYDRIFYWYFPLYRTPWYYTPFSHAATSVQAALPFFLSRQSCDRETSSGANRVIKQGLKHHQNGEMGIAQSYYTQLFRGRNQNLDQLGTVEYSFG
jgi:hypothetical protein